MIRLNGTVKKESQALLAEVFADNPSMNDVYPGDSRYVLDVFCIEEGYGEAFDLSQHPIHRESFALGRVQPHAKAFVFARPVSKRPFCKAPLFAF